MSPFICIKPEDRVAEWMTLDMGDGDGSGPIVVIPLYGPDHRAGMDCWCHPFMDGYGIIVHSKPPH